MSDVVKRTWYALSIADVLFLVLIAGIMPRAKNGMLDDPGLGWHLRNIDAMIAQGGWLSEDPFSGPRRGAPWRTNQWIGDLVLRFGEAWGGKEGIAVVVTLVLAFTFRLLYGMLRVDGVPWPAAAGWTVWAATATAMSWAARPNVASLLFIMLVARACVGFHEGRYSQRRMLWLMPLMMLWANTHGGFAAGLLTMVGAGVIELGIALLTSNAETRQAARSRVLVWAYLFPGCVLATCLNPYGWTLYTWVFKLLGNSYFLSLHTEWFSPDFKAPGGIRYELLMLAVPLLLAVSRRRPNLVELGLSLLWLHYALSSRRFVGLWVLVVVPMLARLCLDVPVLRDWASRVSLSEGLRQLLAGSSSRPRPFLWSVAIGVGLLGWARVTDDYAGHNPRKIPDRALGWLIEHRPGKTILHDYNWGGYVTWLGWPETLNWIDDRTEVQGREHIEEYFSLANAVPGSETILDERGVEIVCFRPKTPLISRLLDHPDWEMIYEDDVAVILERRISSEPAKP
ncbi:hypothetical protein Pan216_45860 [Planctomycetes bacterium Pan216]|uniref:Glycosyltransferase RgtA/B/C/D-like domain-containing protein n=1 Tax=Kolteria novifilia TaxID=2527975 RepID=A0A518B9P2_9BACT|nr:hypothetical protein Pan216_45860 [Planctomycetes bacterium Pan216]